MQELLLTTMSISIVWSNTGVDVPRLKLGNIIMRSRLPDIGRVIIGFNNGGHIVGQEQQLILFEETNRWNIRCLLLQ